jgi:hypothetical protein
MTTARPVAADLVALEEQRDFLLRSLRELEREHAAGEIDDVDHDALHDDLTARAAAVLRAIAARRDPAATAAPAVPPAGAPTDGPARRDRTPLLVGAAVVLVVAVLSGWMLTRTASDRGANDEITGDIRLTTREELEQAQALSRSDPVAALELYEAILERDPSNVEALAFRGWMLVTIVRSSGDAVSEEDRSFLLETANGYLDEAVAADAGFAPARIFRASLLLDLAEPEAAEADIAEVSDDEVPAYLLPLLESLRSRIDEAVGQAAGGS